MTKCKCIDVAALATLQIREGKGEALLTKEQIRDTFPDTNQLVGLSLYVKVSVLTETGKDMRQYICIYMCVCHRLNSIVQLL